jgi:uncharacterized membrane protein YcaP (DUF421 family)
MNVTDALIGIKWSEMFVPDTAILEMMLRGTLTYLGIFTILRVFRRPTGQLNIADVLLITIIADASQNAMAGGEQSVTSGFALIATIVFWDRLIDHLCFKYAWFSRLAQPQPATLVADGEVRRRALDQHEIPDEELLAHLRQHGIEKPQEARLCVLESDGKISVLRFD